MKISNIRFANSFSLMVLMLSVLAACGGGGGGGGGTPGGGGGQALAVAITFPTPNANLGGVETTAVSGRLTVGGAALGADQLNFVRVNGVDAQRDPADPARWTVRDIPVRPGGNTLEIVAEARDGRTGTLSVPVNNLVEFKDVGAMALDANANRVLILDNQAEFIVAMDRATGIRTIVSDPAGINAAGRVVGSGPAWSLPRAMALDAANNRVLVFDDSLQALFGVDLASGDRTVLSDDDDSTAGNVMRGAGPPLPSFATGNVAVDVVAQRAYLIDRSRKAVMAVDLASGDRSILSDDADETQGNIAQGEGPAFSFPLALLIDSARNRLLVADGDRPAIMAVDLVSGTRSVLSGADDNALTRGDGPALIGPSHLVLDTVNDQVVVLAVDHEIVTIDPVSGDRSMLSASAAGPALQSPRDLAIEADQARLLVLDGRLRGITGVNLQTGVREHLFPHQVGAGANYDALERLAFDGAGQRLFALDENLDAIFAIDLRSGDRSLVSDDAYEYNGNASMGTGPRFSSPQDLVLDAAGNRLLLTDSGFGAVIAVDLTSGDRSVMSDDMDSLNGNAMVGEGPALLTPRAIAIDAARNRAIVGDSGLNALFAVDLSDGGRSVLSFFDVSNPIGSGPEFFPGPMSLDFANDRALVFDGENTGLLQIDLASGDRSILLENSSGDRRNNFTLAGIAWDARAQELVYVARRSFADELALGSVDLTDNPPVLAELAGGQGVPILKSLGVSNSVVVDAENRRAFVVDDSQARVIVVDLESGQGAVCSQNLPVLNPFD